MLAFCVDTTRCIPSDLPRRAIAPIVSAAPGMSRTSSGNSSMTTTNRDMFVESSIRATPSTINADSRRRISAAIARHTRSAATGSRSVSIPRQLSNLASGASVAPPLKSNPTHDRPAGANRSAQSHSKAEMNSDFPEPVRPAIAMCGECEVGSRTRVPAESRPTPNEHAERSSHSTMASPEPHSPRTRSQPSVMSGTASTLVGNSPRRFTDSIDEGPHRMLSAQSESSRRDSRMPVGQSHDCASTEVAGPSRAEMPMTSD